jgi:tetratricopeptide (TPR) repeat protein
VDEDAVVRACSTFIDDRSRPPAELSKALNKRALMFGSKASLTSMSYEKKQEFRAREMADYDKAIEFDPIWLYYHNRAEAKRQRRDNASALPDAEKAVELGRKDRSVESVGRANIYETRGAIYLALGQKDKAAADFLTAYRLNPRRTLQRSLSSGQRGAGLFCGPPICAFQHLVDLRAAQNDHRG